MPSRTEAVHYAITLGLCLVAVLIRAPLSRYLGHQSPFFPLVLPIVIAGRLGGFKCGMLATVAGAVLASALFIYPRHELAASSLTCILFLITGAALSWFTGYWRSAELRAAETELYLNRIIQSIGDGVIVVSANRRIWFANRAVSDILGNANLTGRHFDDLLSEIDDNGKRTSIVGEAIRTLMPVTNRKLSLSTNGSDRMEFTASAIPLNQPGRPTSIVVTLQSADGQPIRRLSPGTMDIDRMPVLSPPKLMPSSDPISVLYLDHTARLSGGEIALVRLLGALDRTRFTPHVLLAEDGPLVERLERIGIETHVIPLSDSVRSVRKDTLSGRAMGRFHLVVPFVRYCVNVTAFIRKHKFVILHTNSLKSDIYGGVAGLLTGRPVVWHVRDHIDPSYLPAFAVRAFRWLARIIPSYVITNSQSTRSSLFLGTKRKSVVIPSGIDLRDSVIHDGLSATEVSESDLVEPRILRHSPIRIGIVGRLASWKGQHIFLDAAAKILHGGHKAEFVIIGSAMFGEERYEESLRQQAASLGISQNVTFTGFVNNVPEVMRSLDILTHASTTPEPFGQVIIEGMLEGLPVVGTDGGGVREIIIDKENGMLVPIGDSAALAAALVYLIENPEEANRMANAAQTYVRRKYTIHDSARQVEMVYEELVGDREFRGRPQAVAA